MQALICNDSIMATIVKQKLPNFVLHNLKQLYNASLYRCNFAKNRERYLGHVFEKEKIKECDSFLFSKGIHSSIKDDTEDMRCEADDRRCT